MRSLAERFCWLIALAAVGLFCISAGAQEGNAAFELELPGLSEYAVSDTQTALAGKATVTLAAQLTDQSAEIPDGLVWRLFSPTPGPDGKLPLVATARGGTSTFSLLPGSYLVHASYGRAGATKRITVDDGPMQEHLVLNAGGLKLDAVLADGLRIPDDRLRFSIYEVEPDESGERPLIVPDVRPDSIIRLNAGTYHVVSTYGNVNAIIRSDIRVEAGKLTEATVEHRAAQVTLKLVREAGGEAIADTAWSIVTETGEIVKETVGAFASMVLSEGEYTAVAKNRERIYQRDFTVVPGPKQDVEVLPDNLVPDTSSAE